MTTDPTTTDLEPVRMSLHAGQRQVWASPARFKVVVAGRRWGKTHLVRTWLIAHGLRKGPGRYWYVAPTRDDAKDIIWSDLKAAAEPWTKAKDETDLSVTLTTGAVIRLWSAEKDERLKGRPLKALVIDEYAQMDPELFSEMLRPSLADYKAPAMFIGTPKSFNHFYDLYQRGFDTSRPAWAAWQFRSSDNPFFDPAELEEARRDTDPRTFRQEYEASFETISGRAYYAFSRMDHVKPVTLERGLPVGIAFDFNIDPASAVIWQRVGQECRVWRGVFLRHMGGEATRAAARAVKDWLGTVNWSGQVRLYGDATGKAQKTTGPSDHAVLRDTFPNAVWCVRSANPHVRDRVAAVNGRCRTEDGAIHLRIDPHASNAPLIADLEQVTFKDNGELDQSSNPLLTHISSALGYAIEYEWPPRGGLAVAALPGLRI